MQWRYRGHKGLEKKSWDLSSIDKWTREETEVAIFAGIFALAVISGGTLLLFFDGYYLAGPLIVGVVSFFFLIRAICELNASTMITQIDELDRGE